MLRNLKFTLPEQIKDHRSEILSAFVDGVMKGI
jgi:hypothetical protein